MTIFPFYCLRFLCAGVLIAGGAGSKSVSAQGNPFNTRSQAGAATKPAQTEPAVPLERPAINKSLDEGTQLIIRAIEVSNPQSEIAVAKALSTMIDIEQFDHALYYLSRLQSSTLDDAKRFELYETLGTDFFLQLHALDELQPGGAEFAKEILSAARAQATQPDRVNELVKRLSDEDISARSAAFRKLRRLGPPAVAEMIHVFADPKRQSEFTYVRSALKLLGNDAIAPLLGGARATNLQVQAECVRALGNYRSAEATDVMMRTYLSPKLPESLRRVALDSLMNSDRLPADPGYVEDRFYQRAQEFLMGRRSIVGGLSDSVTVWNWDTKTNQLVPVMVSTATAVRIAAAERAADLYEIRPDSPRNRAMYLLTQLEAAKRISGPSQVVDVDGLMERFPQADAAEIESVLAEALKLELIPAATACCELLGEIGTAELVFGTHQQARPLIQSVQLGDRHLQFAAFDAIAKLDPQQSFAGSSYMLLMGVYMAGSEGRGSGLVGHVRPDMAQTYSATLQDAGLIGRSATGSREFFHEATHDPDLEVLLVTDTLDKPDYAELIQQLRKDFRTKRIPIGLLVRDQNNGVRVKRMVINDPFFSTMPISLDPQQVASHVARLSKLSDPWPVTSLDRRRHAAAAMKWLQQVSNDRERYKFYDLGSHQAALSQLVYLPGFAESGSEILVKLGTPAAQRELLNFASQSSLPIEERKKAAAAFSQAIKNGGTLLTKDQILEQYDRYNASEAEPVETQKLLGSILDALENQADRKN